MFGGEFFRKNIQFKNRPRWDNDILNRIQAQKRRSPTMTAMKSDTECTLLLDRLEENEGKAPSKAAFSFIASGVDGGRISKSCSYQEIQEQTTSLAKYMLTCTGLQRGDRYV